MFDYERHGIEESRHERGSQAERDEPQPVYRESERGLDRPRRRNLAGDPYILGPIAGGVLAALLYDRFISEANAPE